MAKSADTTTKRFSEWQRWEAALLQAGRVVCFNAARVSGERVRRRGRKPPPSFIFWLSFHFSLGQNRKSRFSLSLCSETKRKCLIRRLTRTYVDIIITTWPSILVPRVSPTLPCRAGTSRQVGVRARERERGGWSPLTILYMASIWQQEVLHNLIFGGIKEQVTYLVRRKKRFRKRNLDPPEKWHVFVRIKHNHRTLHAIKCVLRLLLFSTFYCMSRLLKNFNAYSVSRLSIGSLFPLWKLEKSRAKQALRERGRVWASSCPTPSPSALTHTYLVLPFNKHTSKRRAENKWKNKINHW